MPPGITDTVSLLYINRGYAWVEIELSLVLPVTRLPNNSAPLFHFLLRWKADMADIGSAVFVILLTFK